MTKFLFNLKLICYNLLSATILFLVGCSVFERTPSKALLASEAFDNKNYSNAIALYKEHIQERLNDNNRESWENPYFYLLLIGDIYVETGDFSSALSAYEEAKINNIDLDLYLDRIRYIAEKFEENGQNSDAFELLKKHLNLDPLIINELLDRLSRKL